MYFPFLFVLFAFCLDPHPDRNAKGNADNNRAAVSDQQRVEELQDGEHMKYRASADADPEY